MKKAGRQTKKEGEEKSIKKRGNSEKAKKM